MRVRLVRKLAEAIDGVDISDYAVGDVIDLDAREARLLIAEEWAVPAGTPAQRREIRQSSRRMEVADAADSAGRNPIDQLRRASRRIEQRRLELPHGRRREDVLVDELHDSRARTIRTRNA
jgi:hypothetical protein